MDKIEVRPVKKEKSGRKFQHSMVFMRQVVRSIMQENLSFGEASIRAKVFGLAGTLTTAIYRSSHSFAGNMGNAYPNPTASASTIPYTLPQGTNSGEVVFYNTTGTEVKRFKVDNTFADLQITTQDIPAGTYYYQLQVAGTASGTKKLVVVK